MRLSTGAGCGCVASLKASQMNGLCLTAESCGGLDELWQADEIVSGHCENELETELSDASQHGPCEPADGLAPSEWLLDAFSLLLAHRVARMAGGAGIGGGPPAAEVLSDVRRDVERAHVGDE